MLQKVDYDYHAARTNPGVKGIYAAANHPANKVEFQHYVEKHNSEQDRINEKTAAQGITGNNEVQFVDFRTYTLSEPSESDVIALLNNLREKFNIHINTMGSNGLPALDDDYSYDGSDSRILNISVGMLYKMASDSEFHNDISEKIQRWLDGSSEFLEKTGNAVAGMTMSLTEFSELYGYSENPNATTFDRANAKEAWEELVDYLLKWLDERNEHYSERDLSENLFEILLK